MKTPVFWVTASLTAAIAVTASFLIATQTRGENASFASSAGPLDVQTVASGLVNPWALAFLPDGRMLVTERPGRMRIVTPDGKLSPPLQGVPKVCGLRPRRPARRRRSTATLRRTARSISASPSAAGGGGRTAVARADSRRRRRRLDDVKVIFRQDGPLSRGNHFGCRIAQSADNNLFVDHSASTSPTATRRRISTIISARSIRITPDGSVPNDNPFVGRKDAKPEIWSYGHRNAQGAAINPATGKLWETRARPARRRRGQHLRKPARTTAGR